jgi:hypothetical protein
VQAQAAQRHRASRSGERPRECLLDGRDQHFPQRHEGASEHHHRRVERDRQLSHPTRQRGPDLEQTGLHPRSVDEALGVRHRVLAVADGDTRRLDHRALADHGLPAPGAAAPTPVAFVAHPQVAHLPGEPARAAQDLAVADDARPEAHGAGQVDEVTDAAGHPAQALGARRAVGVVVHGHGYGLGEDVVESGAQGLGERNVRPAEVGGVHDHSVCPVDQARHRHGQAEELDATRAQGCDLLTDQPQHLRQPGPVADDGALLEGELPTGQVDNGERQVVDVHLEPEPGEGAALQHHQGAGAATAAGSGGTLGHRPCTLQLAHDRADGALDQVRAPGQLGAAQRSVVAQEPHHHCRVPAAHLVGGRRTRLTDNAQERTP